MSSLFDVIRGSLYLLGGMRQADLEEKDVESQISTRKESLDVARERTAAEKESAAAQRELTATLTREGREHQTSERRESQTFQLKLEELSWVNRIALQSAAEEAAEMRMRFQAGEARQLELWRIASAEKIAAMQEKLQRQGLTIEMEKLQKMPPWQAEFMLKAGAIIMPLILGEGGLFSGFSNEKGFTQKNMDIAQQILDGLVDQIDPNGKYGLKGMRFPRIIVGASPAPAVPSPSSQLPGATIPPQPAPPPGRTGMFPQPMGIDQTATTPMALHPQDEYKINLWTAAIKGLPPKDQQPALDEYAEVLNAEPFVGITNQFPANDQAYRLLLKKSLSQRVNPYSFEKR